MGSSIGSLVQAVCCFHFQELRKQTEAIENMTKAIQALHASVDESKALIEKIAEKTSNKEFRNSKKSRNDYLGACRSLDSLCRGSDLQASRGRCKAQEVLFLEE